MTPMVSSSTMYSLLGAPSDHFSPLAAAAAGGHLDVCRLLVERGAEVNEENPSAQSTGVTPVIAASQAGSTEVVEYLLSLGARRDAKLRVQRQPATGLLFGGSDAFHAASQMGSVEVGSVRF